MYDYDYDYDYACAADLRNTRCGSNTSGSQA